MSDLFTPAHHVDLRPEQIPPLDHPSLPPHQELPSVATMLDEIEQGIVKEHGKLEWPTVAELEAIVDERIAAGPAPEVKTERPVRARRRARKAVTEPAVDLTKN